MTQAFDKIVSISSSLPEDMRESFESYMLSDAEALAAAMREELEERRFKTMLGVEQMKRGEYLTREEWEAHSALFMSKLEAKYPA